MYRVAVDLTWIRHAIVGGTEAYALNLLDGFASVSDAEVHYILLVTKNNGSLFEKYKKYNCFELCNCNFSSMNVKRRIAWQNTKLIPILKKKEIDICIEPVYLKPYIPSKRIKFVTTVHDLQAAHFPQYFSKPYVAWIKMGWWNAIHSSAKIIVTSEYVKNDIIQRYHIDSNKLILNYDPVIIDECNMANESTLKNYEIEKQKYYYMVTSLLPHKNIETIIKALGLLKQRKSDAYLPLVISGTGGKSHDSILELAKANDVIENIVITGFVNDSERNLLYKECKTYLAPSLFEGFNLPPIESMILGAPLLSTHETCSFEISNGIAEYVDNATDPRQWAEKLEKGVRRPDRNKVLELKEKYSKENVARIFNKTVKELTD